MSATKRAREEEDIQIRVAAGEPLTADGYMLRNLSSCARALPADATDWDVSGFQYDGKPFSRETVSCWLSCAQHLVDGSAELGVQDTQQLSTVTGLTQVLAFADAVGSRLGVGKFACSQLQQLKFVVQLPEQVLELPVAGFCIWSDGQQLVQFNLRQSAHIGHALATAEQWHDLQQQVTKQLSALLRIAYVLRLQPLLNVLHQFILRNVVPGYPYLLTDVMGSVFTDAVLEAALQGSSTVSKEAYISSVLSQPCSMTPSEIGHSSLLKPVGPRTYDASTDVLSFDAQLLRDFAGGKAGDTVKVTLDLFGTTILIGRGVMKLQLPSAGPTLVKLPVQLLLGYSFPDAAALKEFLKVNPPV